MKKILLLLLVSCDPGSVIDYQQSRQIEDLQRDIRDLRSRVARMHFCIEMEDLGAQAVCSHNQLMTEDP